MKNLLGVIFLVHEKLTIGNRCYKRRIDISEEGKYFSLIELIEELVYTYFTRIIGHGNKANGIEVKRSFTTDLKKDMNQNHNKFTINNQQQQKASREMCFVSRNLPNMGQILLPSKNKFHSSQHKSRADSKAQFLQPKLN